MMITKTMKKFGLIISLCLLSISAWSSELHISKAVHCGDDDVITTAVFRTPETGDMYAATIINQQLNFITPTGLTTNSVPFIANSTFNGEYKLLSHRQMGLTQGNYPIYQVLTIPGGDPLNVNNWIGGFAGLRIVNLSLCQPREIHGDYDDDGFADDDHDRDGFHDDDHDRDGYHDDDHDRDGYHDDDHDRDGYHDDDDHDDDDDDHDDDYDDD
jgi:hypothetical protein